MRAFPKEKRSIFYLILKFRIIRYVDAFIDDDLVLLAAFAARGQSFVDD
jgi:hypothetical protein